MTDQTSELTDQRAYRDALGAFATGVTIISVIHQGRGVAITANSFTSLSLDPPLVLWCLDAASERAPAFAAQQTFAVSVLCAEDEAVARRFADDATFAPDDRLFERAPNGAPWLARAVARFACRPYASHPGGDHVIHVGEVEAFDQPSSGQPALTYFRGGYGDIG